MPVRLLLFGGRASFDGKTIGTNINKKSAPYYYSRAEILFKPLKISIKYFSLHKLTKNYKRTNPSLSNFFAS